MLILNRRRVFYIETVRLHLLRIPISKKIRFTMNKNSGFEDSQTIGKRVKKQTSIHRRKSNTSTYFNMRCIVHTLLLLAGR